jgi:PEP-CTERM motif
MKTTRHPQIGFPDGRQSTNQNVMNVTFAQLSTKCPNRSGRRLAQMFAATLFVFFLTSVPTLADEVRIGQVVTTLTNSRANPELRLSSQDPVAPGTKGSTQNGPGNQGAPKPDQGANGSDVNVSGVAIINEGASLGVDIIEEGEVEGTICDCGEVFVAGGAFPKWPFLFLGAVPLVFINHCDDCDDDNETSSPTPTPTPTPPSNPTPTPTPPSEVPEPASLILFGTGLAAFGAGLRRRYAKAKLSKQINAQEEE